MKFKLLLILIIVLGYIGCNNNHAIDTDLSTLIDNSNYLSLNDWENLKSKDIQQLLLIDTRSKESYEMNHLEGAIQLSPMELLENYQNEENGSKAQPIVIYSDSVQKIHGTYLALKSATNRPVYLLLANFSNGLEFDPFYAEGIDPAILEYGTTWDDLLKEAKLNAPEPIAVAPPKKKITPKKKIVKEEEEEGC
jgi:rhodanese-related sulfurtransferase